MPARATAARAFPKDTLALIKTAQDYEAPLAHRRGRGGGQREPQARDGAQGQRRRSAASLRGKTVAVLGLTFKPNTDDMRDAPSIPLITGLHDMGAKVRAYDPVGMEQAKKRAARARPIARTPTNARKAPMRWSIVTEWEQFRALDLDRLKSVMAQPVVVDLRNIYRPEDMARSAASSMRASGGARPQG